MKRLAMLPKKMSKKLGQSQRGQGMTEYILLVVVVIALVAAFKTPIMNAINQKMSQVSGDIVGFSGNN